MTWLQLHDLGEQSSCHSVLCVSLATVCEAQKFHRGIYDTMTMFNTGTP